MEEQDAPAGLTQHMPGTLWVQKPQEAQHPALVHQLCIVDVKNRGLGIWRVAALHVRHFSKPSQRQAVQD